MSGNYAYDDVPFIQIQDVVKINLIAFDGQQMVVSYFLGIMAMHIYLMEQQEQFLRLRSPKLHLQNLLG